MSIRHADFERTTGETAVVVSLTLDGTGEHNCCTGIGFLDHMLSALACHSRFNLDISCTGDLYVDDHHTAEDCAIALGRAFEAAIGDRVGIARFGSACVPLDESLARAVVDISGRPYAVIDLALSRDIVGTMACENITHFFRTFATAASLTLHVTVLAGDNDHHRAEASFKALAIALRQAAARDGRTEVPSTKGVL
jgi:imidazoleglycerol phosphate dehydratase HisB